MSLKILVVDDDAGMRHLLQTVLTRSGHQVVVAGDGRVALKHLGAETFDLVISDLVMPEVEGLQLLREVRKLPAPPRVIVISGGGRGNLDNYFEIALKFGAAGTLAKPFTLHALEEEIARAMALGSAAPDDPES